MFTDYLLASSTSFTAVSSLFISLSFPCSNSSSTPSSIFTLLCHNLHVPCTSTASNVGCPAFIVLLCSFCNLQPLITPSSLPLSSSSLPASSAAIVGILAPITVAPPQLLPIITQPLPCLTLPSQFQPFSSSSYVSCSLSVSVAIRCPARRSLLVVSLHLLRLLCPLSAATLQFTYSTSSPFLPSPSSTNCSRLCMLLFNQSLLCSPPTQTSCLLSLLPLQFSAAWLQVSASSVFHVHGLCNSSSASLFLGCQPFNLTASPLDSCCPHLRLHSCISAAAVTSLAAPAPFLLLSSLVTSAQ